MSIITGLFSNGTLCFCCPGVRPRSRQPVKRYKKLLADVFRHSQEEGPNDRKLRKLCEYASRNPLCMPKVWSMGQHCYISAEFDNIVSVVLENYCCLKKASENPDCTKKRWVQEVLKNEGLGSASPDAFPRVPSWKKIVNDKGAFNVTLKDGQNPQFWSRVCLHNMARLANEATTARRILESLFRHFDDGDLWSLQHGIAFPVLKEMQILMDSSGIS